MLANLLGALLLAGAVSPAPPLTEENLPQWLEYIQPAPEELRWQEIPWRTVFAEAVVEAQEQEKPLLMWMMNGHPLACT